MDLMDLMDSVFLDLAEKGTVRFLRKQAMPVFYRLYNVSMSECRYTNPTRTPSRVHSDQHFWKCPM